MSSTPPPSSPINGSQLISVASIEAALAKLNANVTIRDILNVVREEREAKRAALDEESASCTLYSGGPPKNYSPVSSWVGRSTVPDDPKTIERRRRLIEITKKTLGPNGELPPLFNDY